MNEFVREILAIFGSQRGLVSLPGAAKLTASAHLVQLLERVLEVVSQAARAAVALRFSVSLNLGEEALESFAFDARCVKLGLSEQVDVTTMGPGCLIDEVLNTLKEIISKLRKDIFL